MNHSYPCAPMRLALAALAVSATTTIGLFIDELARNPAPAQHAATSTTLVVAKVPSSR